MIDGSSEILSTEDLVGVGAHLSEFFENYCMIIFAALMFGSSYSRTNFYDCVFIFLYCLTYFGLIKLVYFLDLSVAWILTEI